MYVYLCVLLSCIGENKDYLLTKKLPRLRKREIICLLLFTCNYVVSVLRGFLLLLVLGMGGVILL